MGIVNAELFIVGAGEEKMESKSSRLQRVEFLSPFHQLWKLPQTMERHARLGEILLPVTFLSAAPALRAHLKFAFNL
jgi:hypothetical protein